MDLHFNDRRMLKVMRWGCGGERFICLFLFLLQKQATIGNNKQEDTVVKPTTATVQRSDLCDLANVTRVLDNEYDNIDVAIERLTNCVVKVVF
jgi:hypothetical protein